MRPQEYRLERATLAQLKELAKNYQKRFLREPPGPEKKRLGLQANRVRAIAKMRSRRVPSPEQTDSLN